MSCTTCTNGSSPKGCKNNGSCGVEGCGKLTVFDWLSDIQLPSSQERYDIVEVHFKNDRKGYYKNENNIPLQIGDIVVVNAESGIDVGRVSLTGELVKTQQKIKKVRSNSILPLYRKATQEDIDKWVESRNKEESTKIEARKIANRLRLSMKISDVEYQADGSKVTFYYTSESRVDFRQLIREYATAFRTKIDMRQIGYRQETAKVGGIGSCGRELCCSSWLTDFRSVSTSAARYQQLSINPQKLAGQCGKLKCCLNYELDSYLDALNDFPSQNTSLKTEKGKANCVKIDVFRKQMFFMYEDNPYQWFEFSTEEVKEMIAKNKKGQTLPPLEDLKEDHEKVSADIIEENSLDRFERKKRRNNRSKNAHRSRKKNSPKPSNNKAKSPNASKGRSKPQKSSNHKKNQASNSKNKN